MGEGGPLQELLDRLGGPVGVRVYEVQGQEIFPVYAASGGLSTKKVFYLYKRALRDEVILILPAWLMGNEEYSMRVAIGRWEAGKYKAVNENSGDLGLPEV